MAPARRTQVVLGLLALACSLALLVPAQAAAGDVAVEDAEDFWDQADLDAPSTGQQQQQAQRAHSPPPQQQQPGAPDIKPGGVEPAKPVVRQPLPRKPFDIQDYKLESLALIFVAIFVLQIARGRGANQQLALAWARTFAQEGAVLERNFSLLGPDEESGPEILTRESGSEYQLYASGRRYCQAMVFTLDLKKRQDLFSLAYYILNPRLDALFVEVFMNETSMPPIVLAIAPPKVAKELAKDNADIVKFARKIEINRERCPSWPADKLAVYAEHSSVFYELMPEPLLEQVFNRATWDTVGRYFKYLHFTSEAHLNGSREAAPADKDAAKKAAEPPRNVLKFALALPPQDRMEDLGRLMNMMMTFIDVVGTFKLSPEQQKRADRVRQEYEESKWKEAEKQRMEAIQEKKAQRKAEEKERVKNMSAEAYQKWEERQQRIQTKRAIKARTKKL